MAAKGPSSIPLERERSQHHSIVLNNIITLWENSELCDIALKTNDQTFWVHKIILASNSRMFYYLFKDKTASDTHLNTIECSKYGISSNEVILAMVEFMYTGKTHISGKLFGDIMYAASVWNVPSLLEILPPVPTNNILPVRNDGGSTEPDFKEEGLTFDNKEENGSSTTDTDGGSSLNPNQVVSGHICPGPLSSDQLKFSHLAIDKKLKFDGEKDTKLESDAETINTYKDENQTQKEVDIMDETKPELSNLNNTASLPTTVSLPCDTTQSELKPFTGARMKMSSQLGQDGNFIVSCNLQASDLVSETSKKCTQTENLAGPSSINDKNLKLKNLRRCYICHVSFSQPTSLYKHLKKHSAQSKMRSVAKVKISSNVDKGCDKLPEPSSPSQELEPEFPIENETFHCKYCDVQDTLEGITAHTRTYHAEVSGLPPINVAMKGRTLCKICKVSFATVSTLIQHMRAMHPEECGLPPFVKSLLCDICGNSFTQMRYLKQHKLSHNEPHLKCTQCEKCFCYRRRLLDHIKKMHSLCKPDMIMCHLCGKNLSKRNLKIHLRNIHSGCRPWECPLCQKSFKTKAHLKQHTDGKHEATSWTCPICERSYAFKVGLQAHVATKHKGQKVEFSGCANHS